MGKPKIPMWMCYHGSVMYALIVARLLDAQTKYVVSKIGSNLYRRRCSGDFVMTLKQHTSRWCNSDLQRFWESRFVAIASTTVV